MESQSNVAMKDGGETNISQLDLLRGLAIVLMIVNHAGTSLLDPRLQRSGPFAALIFIGSFAPVVFFFTTGFGIGIGKRDIGLAKFGSVLVKAVLLVIADQFLFWKNATPSGLDFLGFIALSSVVTTVVAAYRRPVRLCVVLISVVLALRFGLGPRLRPHLLLPAVLEWLVGIRSVDSVSYPFSPWIVYPLIGFLMAHQFKTVAASIKHFLWPWPGAVSIGALAIAAAMSRSNADFFRWGTMSFAYFVLSIGVIFVSIFLAWQIQARWRQAARLLSLRGIASLAAVPIHYGLIAALAASGAAQLGPLSMVAVTAGLIGLTVVLSTEFAAGVRRWMSDLSLSLTWIFLVTLVVLSAVTIWHVQQRSVAAFASFVVGQLAIAALLAARNRPLARL